MSLYEKGLQTFKVGEGTPGEAFRLKVDSFLHGDMVKKWPTDKTVYEINLVRHIYQVYVQLYSPVYDYYIAALKDPRNMLHEHALNLELNELNRFLKVMGDYLQAANKAEKDGQSTIELPELRNTFVKFLIWVKNTTYTIESMQDKPAWLGPEWLWHTLIKLWQFQWNVIQPILDLPWKKILIGAGIGIGGLWIIHEYMSRKEVVKE